MPQQLAGDRWVRDVFGRKNGYWKSRSCTVFRSVIPHPICHLLDEMGKKGDIFPMESVRDEGKKGERWTSR